MSKIKKFVTVLLLVIVAALVFYHRNWISDKAVHIVVFDFQMKVWQLFLIIAGSAFSGFALCSCFVAQNDKYYCGMVDGIELGRRMRKAVKQKKPPGMDIGVPVDDYEKEFERQMSMRG